MQVKFSSLPPKYTLVKLQKELKLPDHPVHPLVPMSPEDVPRVHALLTESLYRCVRACVRTLDWFNPIFPSSFPLPTVLLSFLLVFLPLSSPFVYISKRKIVIFDSALDLFSFSTSLRHSLRTVSGILSDFPQSTH